MSSPRVPYRARFNMRPHRDGMEMENRFLLAQFGLNGRGGKTETVCKEFLNGTRTRVYDVNKITRRVYKHGSLPIDLITLCRIMIIFSLRSPSIEI